MQVCVHLCLSVCMSHVHKVVHAICVCVSTSVHVGVCVWGWGYAGVLRVSAGYVSHETQVQLISLHSLEASVV